MNGVGGSSIQRHIRSCAHIGALLDDVDCAVDIHIRGRAHQRIGTSDGVGCCCITINGHISTGLHLGIAGNRVGSTTINGHISTGLHLDTFLNRGTNGTADGY